MPDIEQAHEFLVGVLGCELAYTLPEMRHDDDWMSEHLNVDPRRAVRQIRFYRCGFGLNFEVFEYEPHDGQRDVPRNSDLGGHHVALYVDDMDAAARVPGRQGRPPADRPGSQQERLGRAALAVLPCALGHAVRAGQLPGRQGIRAGRGGGDAVAPGSPGAVTGPIGSAGPGSGGPSGLDGHGGASSRIAAALRTAILDGSYRPGERIRQEDVAARSGASRIPVREALRTLQSEGLVTLVANSGAWVTKLTLAECAELYQIRERLEPLLLRASLPALDGDAIGRLTELAAEMEAADGVVDAFLRADRAFHWASYAGAGPGETTGSHRPHVEPRTQHYRREFTRLAAGRSGLGATHLEHRLLIDCLRRADADDAERVLVMHIRRTRSELARHPEIFG